MESDLARAQSSLALQVVRNGLRRSGIQSETQTGRVHRTCEVKNIKGNQAYVGELAALRAHQGLSLSQEVGISSPAGSP